MCSWCVVCRTDSATWLCCTVKSLLTDCRNFVVKREMGCTVTNFRRSMRTNISFVTHWSCDTITSWVSKYISKLRIIYKFVNIDNNGLLLLQYVAFSRSLLFDQLISEQSISWQFYRSSLQLRFVNSLRLRYKSVLFCPDLRV